jgi:hypothetical protein
VRGIWCGLLVNSNSTIFFSIFERQFNDTATAFETNTTPGSTVILVYHSLLFDGSNDNEL